MTYGWIKLIVCDKPW